MDRPLPNIEYVAYFDGKAIAKDEYDHYYFQELPEDLFVAGEVAFIEDLTPVDELPEEERYEIYEFLDDNDL
ncbi:MAG: hypothetical protein K2H01_12535 [Ruminococcus sp.]|nr:hypothetical protein [Ruminococcus sp.]